MLWRSDAMREHKVTQAFNVDVSRVAILELRTYTETGRCFGSHAVWLDPFVTTKP